MDLVITANCCFRPPGKNDHTFSCKETLVNTVSLLRSKFSGPLVTVLTWFHCTPLTATSLSVLSVLSCHFIMCSGKKTWKGLVEKASRIMNVSVSIYVYTINTIPLGKCLVQCLYGLNAFLVFISEISAHSFDFSYVNNLHYARTFHEVFLLSVQL